MNGKNEMANEIEENFTSACKNIINAKDDCAEDLAQAVVESRELDKCNNTDTVGDVMNLKDVSVENFTDSTENLLKCSLCGECVDYAHQNVMSTTNEYISDAQADANMSSSNVDSTTESLSDNITNIIISSIKSDGTKEGTSDCNENSESVLEYQENSEFSFSQLVEKKKPIEIKKPGKLVLSKTERGESSVLFEPFLYSDDEAWELFHCLYGFTNWLDKNIVIHGVEYPQPRLVAWYGPLPYSYSGTTLEAAEMPDCVLAIKKRVEDYLRGNGINAEFNSVLLNLYRSNNDSVSWHSDDELTMGICPTIASISLGETRKFEMRPKLNRYDEDKQQILQDEYFVHLNHGSLVVMDGCMQEDWQHRVPKEYHDRQPRINLTFRTVYKYEDGSPYSNTRINNHKSVPKNSNDIPKNSNRTRIDVNEENFPPLKLVSSNKNSKTSHCYEPLSRKNDKINNSEEEWIVKTPPANHAISRINDGINLSQEEWIVETPTANNAISRINDEIYLSQEEWIVETPTTNNAISRINDEINLSQKEWIVETPTTNHAISRINDEINSSEEEWIVQTPIKTKSPIEKNDAVSISQREFASKSLNSYRTYCRKDNAHEFIENSKRHDGIASFNKPSTRTNYTRNKSKRNAAIESASNNGAYLEANDKVKKSENTAVKYMSYSKPLSDINDTINTSEEEWNIDSPEKNKSCIREINKSQYHKYEESANKIQQNHSGNKSYKDWYDELHDNQLLSESDEMNVREEKYKQSSDYQKQTSWGSNKVYRSNENYFDKTHYKRIPSESNKFHENRNAKSSYSRQNQFQSDRINKYEEKTSKPCYKRNLQSETNRYQRYNERGTKESYYEKNASRQDKNFKTDEVKKIENTTVSNNLNSEKKNEKLENLNKDIDDHEQRPGKNQISNSKEKRNESSNFAVHCMRSHFSDIRNEPGSNRSSEWKPNVKAEEFVPGKIKKISSKLHTLSTSVDSSTFGHFSLEDLLNYDIDRMPSDELQNYANTLKSRIFDRILEFGQSDKEELQVLCEITDGHQTDRNQKIICSRICALVNRTIPNIEQNLKITAPIPRYQATYRNENYYADRRYQDSS